MTKRLSFRKKKPIKIGNILQNIFIKIPNCIQKGSVFMKKLHEKDIEFKTGFGECVVFCSYFLRLENYIFS